MLKNREYCLICGEKLEKSIRNDDPLFYYYKCNNCGNYLPLEEFDSLVCYYTISHIKRNLLLQKIAQIKAETPYYDNLLLAIGTKEEIENFKNSHKKEILTDKRFEIYEIEYSFINQME